MIQIFFAINNNSMIKLYFKGFSFEYCFTIIDMGISGNQESYEIKYISAPTDLMMGALQEESITRKDCYEILQFFLSVLLCDV